MLIYVFYPRYNIHLLPSKQDDDEQTQITYMKGSSGICDYLRMYTSPNQQDAYWVSPRGDKFYVAHKEKCEYMEIAIDNAESRSLQKKVS